MSSDIDSLEAERKRLYQEISKTGDFRRGSIIVNYRRCGKPNCACAQPGHPGHGPQYRLTTKVAGQTHVKNLRPGRELEIVENEVANHQRFRELIRSVVEVSEQICDIRETLSCDSSHVESEADAETTAQKGASKTASKRKSSRNSTIS